MQKIELLPVKRNELIVVKQDEELEKKVAKHLRLPEW
jgi:hypothetical protein